MKSLLSVSGEGTGTSSYIFRSFSPILEQQNNRIEAYQWNTVTQARTEDEAEERIPQLDQEEVEIVSSRDSAEEDVAVPVTRYHQTADTAQSAADSVLQDARVSAEKILESARQEAAELRKTAQEEGQAAGYEQGMAEGLKNAEQQITETIHDRLQQNLETVRELIESVETEKDRLLRKHLAELRDLTLSIAEKIVNISLRSSSGIIEKMILAATEKNKHAQWVKINIAKSDAEIMMLSDEELIRALSHLSDNITIARIENVEPGECVIEFPDELIDASVKTQLDHIREAITSEEITLGDTD